MISRCEAYLKSLGLFKMQKHDSMRICDGRAYNGMKVLLKLNIYWFRPHRANVDCTQVLKSADPMGPIGNLNALQCTKIMPNNSVGRDTPIAASAVLLA